MHYLNETAAGLDWFSPKCTNNHIFEYSLDRQDYFLNYRMIWREVDADFYEMVIGNQTFFLPSGFYVMIGDVFGELDWIMIDEMIGRDLECVILSPGLETWSLHTPKLKNVSEKRMFWPKTTNIIPVRSGDRVLMISDKDFYHKTKDLIINSLVM